MLIPLRPVRVLGTLAAIALVCVLASSSAAASGSGITGETVLSPTCPGPIHPGERCARAIKATITIYTMAGHRLVMKVRSTGDGHFRATLSPGRYRVIGTHRGYPRAVPVTVRVRHDHFSTVTVRFDTGIR